MRPKTGPESTNTRFVQVHLWGRERYFAFYSLATKLMISIWAILTAISVCGLRLDVRPCPRVYKQYSCSMHHDITTHDEVVDHGSV